MVLKATEGLTQRYALVVCAAADGCVETWPALSAGPSSAASLDKHVVECLGNICDVDEGGPEVANTAIDSVAGTVRLRTCEDPGEGGFTLSVALASASTRQEGSQPHH